MTAKPKILVTGMNKAQCNRNAHSAFLRLQIVPSHYSLVNGLEAMGYEVEQRVVKLGEDLSEYEDVIAIVHPTAAFTQYLWSGLYAIGARPDCIVAFDDWQFPGIFKDIIGYKKQLEEGNGYRDYLWSNWGGKESLEEVQKYESFYKDACDSIVNGKNRLLMSAFAGGDLSLLSLEWPSERVFTYNPNPYHLNRRPDNNFGLENDTDLDMFDEPDTIGIRPEKKLREWNFASLVHNKTRKWMKSKKVEWKVNFFGASRGEYKCERVTETEMCRIFNKQWGCLMPAYSHAGSGWWRARPLQVADAGSILLCDQKEAEVYGEAYENLTADKIEGLDTAGLVALAKAQKDCLYEKHPLTKRVQREELQKILDARK